MMNIVVKTRTNLAMEPLRPTSDGQPPVGSLTRGLEILACFRPGDTFLGNKEICERVGLPKQTVSRLTLTLVKLGYLTYSASLCKYRLGGGVLALAYPLLTSMSVRRIVRPFMEDLANEVGGSVSIGQRFQNQMMFIDSCTVRGTANHAAEIGSLIPMHMTAMGKAYLASAPVVERVDIVASLGLEETAVKKLNAEIQRAARDIALKGFCDSEGHFKTGRIAAAVPLCQPIDGELFVINCGFARYAMTPERIDQEIGPRLVNLVRTAEGVLGLR